MKRTYISPETLAVEPYIAQGVMDGLIIMSAGKKADKDATVLTKRKVWDDVDDEEEW